jgi:hypothetical protein
MASMPQLIRDTPTRALAVLLLLSLASVPLASASDLPKAPILRDWIEEMKESPRGPFERLRWFCADGSVLPPKSGACVPHGGGVQHGEWNERATALRENGYLVANVLADLDPSDFIGPDANLSALRQILLERFLISWDSGWIFRGARSYRGALQAEDEEAASRATLLAMLGDPSWRDPARFALLREAVRLLPVRAEKSLASEVRVAALEIADRDADFMPLRAKIHGSPDPGDADRVRAYAEAAQEADEDGRAELADAYEQLAVQIDTLYASDAANAIDALAETIQDRNLSEKLAAGARRLRETEIPGQRLAILGDLLTAVRDRFPKIAAPETALAALDASLAIEDEIYAAGNALTQALGGYSRQQRLWLLEYSSRALYGAGFLSQRHLKSLKDEFVRLEDNGQLDVNAYRRLVGYLARVPEWSNRWLTFLFGPAVEHLALIEPEVRLYSQDRMRGSPLLFYSAVVDSLSLDVDRLAGIRHELFGETIGAGLRALNPGLAEGTLRTDGGVGRDRLESDGIHLLPETTSELTRVAGILTEGEGSSLSHIQLLARNLGIPNVVVGTELLPRVRERSGTRVVMAVSPGGVVQLAERGPKWDAVFEDQDGSHELVIRPDLEKLDLAFQEFTPLANLRATDSGRRSGPKGANLGELKFLFGDAVPGGFVIPFGAFRSLLDRKIAPGEPSVFEWMIERYGAIDAASGDPERRAALVSGFLERLRSWILTVELSPEFVGGLRTMLEQTFGPDGTYGVFVRSDTNVEDLPGFTGAGLNLTVPNVRGFDNIVTALREVWASPFTERAFGWRQANMEQPEYVFPAVVVQRATPSEKSGVMVTTDVAGGGMDFATIAVNEGVGGAVDGQASESLLIDLRTGESRFLAQATAPTRATLARSGGVTRIPASGTDAVLRQGEIHQLVKLARSLPVRFPSISNEDGTPMPADVEFAFLNGKLVLLQIRPFVESDRARSASYLQQLDAGLRERGSRPVDLRGVPGMAPITDTVPDAAPTEGAN